MEIAEWARCLREPGRRETDYPALFPVWLAGIFGRGVVVVHGFFVTAQEDMGWDGLLSQGIAAAGRAGAAHVQVVKFGVCVLEFFELGA